MYKKTKCLFINNGIWLFLFLLNVLFTVCLQAQEETNHYRADSLHSRLTEVYTPKDKIAVLQKLVDLYWRKPEEVSFLQEIIRLASYTDSSKPAYDAMANLSRYYYNKGMKDSLHYWKFQLDTLARQKKEYPDALFMAGSFICLNYLSSKKYELAMNEAISLLSMAESAGQEYGVMIANQSLAIVYQAVNRDADALDVLTKGLVWLRKNINNEAIELQYLSDMIVSSLRLNLFDETKALLIRYNELLEQLKKESGMSSRVYFIQQHNLLLNSYYAELYARRDQLDKSRVYLNKITPDMYTALGDGVKYPYFQAKAFYYKKTGNNTAALEVIDKALALEHRVEMLKMKVDVLRACGRVEEALVLYDEVLTMTASIQESALTRQINQLRTLNNLNDREKIVRDLEYQKKQIAVKQYQLAIVILILLLLLILFYVLIRFYRRTGRLKNELLKEKESLEKTEKQLQQAKQEAIKANEKKTDFLSSISHEIRTPLNGIVGFSELLINDISEEEKEICTTTINQNSEFLLNLVNNVLDLSRLESTNFKYSIKECDLVDCCRKAIASIEHHIAPEVKFTFISIVDCYIIESDSLRIQQLLQNLLSNAFKFTKQGEINLSFEPDEVNQQVRFIVTDTGCGIPLEKQSKIFERFEKLNEFMKGTGLGLSICKIIATGLGGTIFVDSSYTQGARFVFVLPCEMKS